MSTELGHSAKGLPIACELSEDRQEAHKESYVVELFSECEAVNEIEGGYEFRFPGDAKRAVELARFVDFERECCRFFAFELFFEPDLGPIWLRMRGSDGTKAFLRGEFTEEFARKHSVDLD